MTKKPRARQKQNKKSSDGKITWRERWSLFGRITLLWMLAVLVCVPAAYELLKYLKWDLGYWFWGLAYLPSTIAFIWLIKPIKHRLDLAYAQLLILPALLMFPARAGVEITTVLLRPPITVKSVADVKDWRSIDFVKIQEPVFYFEKMDSNYKNWIEHKKLGNDYINVSMVYKVPMDKKGWVFFYNNCSKNWSKDQTAQELQRLELEFIKYCNQEYLHTNFADARFFHVNAAPRSRGGHHMHADLHAEFMSFQYYSIWRIKLAGTVILISLFVWLLFVRFLTVLPVVTAAPQNNGNAPKAT